MLSRLGPSIQKCFRRPISALYITGDKANQNYAILTPFFDFKSRLDAISPESLHANIRSRRSSVDLAQLLQMWQVYRDVQQKKSSLERRRIEIADILKEMTKKGKEVDEDLQRKYKAEGTFVREDLKRLKENSYHMEDLFVHRYLALPNELHARTPLDLEDVVHSFLDRPAQSGSSQPHLSASELIEYHDPYCYFLRGKAAEFDIDLLFGFVDAFRKSGFVHFSNPDFCKSILAEAAGLEPNQLLTIKDDNIDEAASVNLTHLAGASSLIGYLGYITKLSVFKSALPLRLVSSGRSYIRTRSDTPDLDRGLFSVSQSNRVQIFQALADSRQAENAFDECVSELAELFQLFGRHFRIVQIPAHRLGQAESMRINVEMYNSHREEYIEVGHVAYYGDYISKRLLFSYKDPSAKQDDPLFPHLIAGTAVDVTRVLAVLLENEGEGALEVPKALGSIR